ncbi:MAG: bifunctional 4-hydroxy-3-methylbut-2-enyl diphosphate reductase/30S ribosomal protein S1 [Angelakisella sp.]
MKIITAKSAGYCAGVKRAVDMTFAEAAQSELPLVVLGELVHNPLVSEQLAAAGVRTVDAIEDIPKGSKAVIRAHGVPPELYRKLDSMGIPYMDTTCPLVKKVQDIAAEKSPESILLLMGDSTHPEVIGIAGHAQGRVFILKTAEELENTVRNMGDTAKSCFVLASQTTFLVDEWNKCTEIAKKVCTNLKIFDTICKATVIRQREAEELSRSVDGMIVIGGRNSSNTRKLYDISAQHCNTFFVEQTADIEGCMKKLSPMSIVGITAGASTPACIIKEVQESMSRLDNISNEMSFEEMLEQSFKSTYNGEKVLGIVTGIKPNEISVDIGTKHAGYVPLHELTDDPNAKAEDIVKVGDEIQLLVVRVNDVEGTTMLSKRRLDAAAGFEKVMDAGESGEILTGIVTEVIKGGILVLSNGVKVFVPASQSSVPRDGDLATMLRKEVSFKILETNRQRRRALGSISAVIREQRKELAGKFWDTVEVGKEYTGLVKSITNFGVFVDLGGVDGRIGLSDLTWLRVKHPSEVVSIGQTVTVTVKDIDNEEKKISLIYKKSEDNPWERIRALHQVGDVVTVKIMSITAFGAFAQIIPGIDGLIHISQISKERVDKVGDKLKVGDEVEAKITELDYDRKRASLSIKALLGEDEESVEAPVDAE